MALVERAQPAWLMLALVLQAATYATQSRLWQVALSPARKVLVAMTQTHGHFELVGVDSKPLAASLEDLTQRVVRLLATK